MLSIRARGGRARRRRRWPWLRPWVARCHPGSSGEGLPSRRQERPRRRRAL